MNMSDVVAETPRIFQREVAIRDGAVAKGLRIAAERESRIQRRKTGRRVLKGECTVRVLLLLKCLAQSRVSDSKFVYGGWAKRVDLVQNSEVRAYGRLKNGDRVRRGNGNRVRSLDLECAKEGIAIAEAMVYAAKIIRDLKVDLSEFSLVTTFTVMEEDCDGLCWQYIVNEDKIRPDVVVVTDSTDCKILRGQRGQSPSQSRVAPYEHFRQLSSQTIHSFMQGPSL